MEKRASVLCAGHVGCAMAVDFIDRMGTHVMLYAHHRHFHNALSIRQKGRLTSTGEVECTVSSGKQGDKLSITSNMQEAVNFSRFLFLTVPSYGYDDILAELTENDLSNHVLTLIPGNFSALVVFLAFLHVEPKFRPRFILETSSSPQACRAKDGDVHVFGMKSMLHIGALPVDFPTALRREMQGFFPKRSQWVANVLEIDFLCVNPVIHAVAVIMYADLIKETQGNFYFYRDMPDSVVEAIEAADEERRALAIHYAGRDDRLLDLTNDLYQANFPDMKTSFRNSPHHANIKGPARLDDRMFREEVQVLAGWIEFGALAGIECPVFNWVVEQGHKLLGKNFARSGRTFENLELSGLSAGHIIDIFNSTQDSLENALKLAFVNRRSSGTSDGSSAGY
jgi:opine dehydrogenase